MVEIKYFVHGTTIDNIEKKASGWQHGELSEKGIQQAINLEGVINNEYFAVVFCSDLKKSYR